MNARIYKQVKVIILLILLYSNIRAIGAVHDSTVYNNPNCWNGTGTAYSFATGGASPYTMKWFSIGGIELTTRISVTSGTSTITGLTMGTYYSLIVDSEGSRDSVVFTILTPPEIVISYTKTDVTCNGGSTGTATISATGGTGRLTGTGLKTDLSAGTHTYTVTDVNGCSATATVVILQPLVLAVTGAETDVMIHGGNDGTATVMATGGTTGCSSTASTFENGLIAPIWSAIGNYSVNSIYAGITPTEGSYQCFITPIGSSYDSSTIEIFAGLPAGSLSNTFGGYLTNGSALKRIVSVNAGDTLTVDWNYLSTDFVPYNDPSFVSITGNGVTLLADATTTIQDSIYDNINGISFQNGYQNFSFVFPTSGAYTITLGVFNVYDTVSNPGLLIDNFRINGCSGPRYNYSWNTIPIKTSEVATGLTAGTYTATVTDYRGCSATTSVTVNQPTTLISVASVITSPILCNGGTGVVTVSASGGTSPYTGTGSYTVNSGTFTFTVTDAHQASAVTTLTITQPSSLSASTSVVTPVLCNGGNAVINISASGGNPLYRGTGNYTIAAGAHLFVITDGNGCSANATLTIEQPTALSAISSLNTPVSCNGGTAVVSVDAIGGTEPYTGTTSYTVTAGTYTYTVTDANGCSSSTTISVGEPSELTVTGNATDVSCYGGSNGVAMVTANGGTLLSTNPVVNGSFESGNYNGWTLYSSIPVTGQFIIGNSGVSIPSNSQVFDFANNQMELTTSPGLPYTPSPTSGSKMGMLVENGRANHYLYQDVTLPTGNVHLQLDLGYHNFMGNFSATQGVAISLKNPTTHAVITTLFQTSASSPSIRPLSGMNFDLSAYAGQNIRIEIDIAVNVYYLDVYFDNIRITGGTVGYAYSWNSNPIQTLATATGLSAGTYTATVTDGHGCLATTSVSVGQPSALLATSIATSPVACNGGTAVVTVSANGGTGPYSGTGNHTVTAGIYSYTVTDANGCISTTTISVLNPAVVTLTSTGTNVSCNGNNDGTITVIAAGGTTTCANSALTFENGLFGSTWSTIGTAEIDSIYGGIIPSEGAYQALVTTYGSSYDTTAIENFAGLNAGSLTSALGNYLTNGSAMKRTFSVNAGDTLKVDWDYLSVDYAPFVDPSFLSITGNGVHFLADVSTTNLNAIGTNSFGFIYQNEYQTFNYIFTASGTYTVTLGVFNAIDQMNDAGLLVDKFRINTECTSSGYSYVWNTNPVQTTSTATGLPAGTYTATVTDQSGCTASTSISINQPEALSASSSLTAQVQCNGGTAVVNVTATGGTSLYTGTGSYTVLAGVNTFTVTDTNGCNAITTITITEPSALLVSSSTTSITCNGGTAVVSITATGGTTGYTGVGSFTVVAGTYSYTVTDANGCSTSTTIIINQPAALFASSVITSPITSSVGTATVKVTATGGTESYTGTGSYSVSAGTYTYTVTDANGCKATSTITVSQPTTASVTVSSSVTTPIVCYGGAGVATVTCFGGIPPYSCNGRTFTTNTCTYTVTAGNYTYTISDHNGHTSSTSIIVTQPTVLVASSTVTKPISCYGGTGELTITCYGGVPHHRGCGHSNTTNSYTYTVTSDRYTYTVTDDKGCSASTTITVNQPSPLVASATVTKPITCYGGTAEILVISNGGVPHRSGCGHSNITNSNSYTVTAGSYTFTVADHNGRSATTTITVSQPSAITASSRATSPTCWGKTGIVTVIATNGTPNYSYGINGSVSSIDTTWITNNMLGGLATGIYHVIVKDANGCIVSAGIDTIKALKSCSGNTTFSMSGWHNNANQTGLWLSSHWSTTFGGQIIIGNYSGGKGIKFTTVTSVKNFQPGGAGCSSLITNYLNPSSNSLNNYFAGQLLTATLNIGYSSGFGNLVIGTGIFTGKTVGQLIAIANQALAGMTTGYTNTAIASTLSMVNTNYDNNGNNGNLFSNCLLAKTEALPFIQGSENSSTVNNENDLSLYPNPSNSTVTISFTLTNDTDAKIEIYNIAGQLVTTLFNEKALNNLKYELKMDGREMSPGMYFCKLSAGEKSLIKKVMIVR